MATLPKIGAKATNSTNAIPEAGSSRPSWPRASEMASDKLHTRVNNPITKVQGLLKLKTHKNFFLLGNSSIFLGPEKC